MPKAEAKTIAGLRRYLGWTLWIAGCGCVATAFGIQHGAVGFLGFIGGMLLVSAIVYAISAQAEVSPMSQMAFCPADDDDDVTVDAAANAQWHMFDAGDA